MAEPEQHSVRVETSYVVLRLTPGNDTWKDEVTIQARDAEDAIRRTYQRLDESRGDSTPQTAATFVAVPARSWKPITVKPQVVTTLSLEQVKS